MKVRSTYQQELRLEMMGWLSKTGLLLATRVGELL
jgi:hypothetical protein